MNSIATLNGIYADFSPKPIKGSPGNGMHINFSAKCSTGRDVLPHVIAGILEHISEMTVFLNTVEDSYERLGSDKAPQYISWSSENRSQLIRIPAAFGEYRRAELRSPDPLCNPYLAYALLIHAGLDGIRNGYDLPQPVDINLYTAPAEVTAGYERLPEKLEDARKLAMNSDFIASVLPDMLIEHYTR